MTSSLFLVGDVFERLRDVPDASIDLAITSPPFLALRSYLPADHPDKAKELGSEPTPAEFLDAMLVVVAELGRVLAPHGSLAFEFGDTYSGSGGSGGDYSDGGLREGQATYSGTARTARSTTGRTVSRDRDHWAGSDKRPDWPMFKSLCFVPELFGASLAYGRNLLTGEPSPAGMWRVRNFKPWIRSNPPVGALGDKERPATSYITVATLARDRYFDLDAVRTTSADTRPRTTNGPKNADADNSDVLGHYDTRTTNPAGAPPLDWWHHVDAVIDAEIDRRAGKHNGGENPAGRPAGEGDKGRRSGTTLGQFDDRRYSEGVRTVGARGVHIRRALETAGLLTTLDALDVTARGYKGSHYAVFPPELVERLVKEMCPPRVCTACGEPSRRLVDTGDVLGRGSTSLSQVKQEAIGRANSEGRFRPPDNATRDTVGWSCCGCGEGCRAPEWGKEPVLDPETGEPKLTKSGKQRTRKVLVDPGECADPAHWRRGVVLDPFIGSGTTLVVAAELGHDGVGIDLDDRNVALAEERLAKSDAEVELTVDRVPPERALVGSYVDVTWTLPTGEPQGAAGTLVAVARREDGTWVAELDWGYGVALGDGVEVHARLCGCAYCAHNHETECGCDPCREMREHYPDLYAEHGTAVRS